MVINIEELEIIKTPYNQDIFFLFMLVSFFLIALIKGVYWKYAKLHFMGVFSQSYANQYLREASTFTDRVDLLTFGLLNINFTLIAAKLQLLTNFFEIALLFVAIALFFLIKSVLIKMFGALFKLKDLARIAIFFSLLFDKTLAFILSPLIVIMYFFAFDIASFVILALALLFIFQFCLKIFSLWRIGTNSFGLSRPYIFLYLCAFEVTPVLLLVKVLFY